MQICCSPPTLASRPCRTRIKVWANETSIRADVDIIHIACTASTPSTAHLSTLRYTWVTCKMIFASNCRGSCSANDSSSNGKLPEDKNNWIFQLRAANSFVAALHTHGHMHIYMYVQVLTYVFMQNPAAKCGRSQWVQWTLRLPYNFPPSLPVISPSFYLFLSFETRFRCSVDSQEQLKFFCSSLTTSRTRTFLMNPNHMHRFSRYTRTRNLSTRHWLFNWT